MYPLMHMLTFVLLLPLWPFPIVQILLLPQRSAHGGTAVADAIGVGEAVGVAVDVGCPIGMAVAVGVGG